MPPTSITPTATVYVFSLPTLTTTVPNLDYLSHSYDTFLYNIPTQWASSPTITGTANAGRPSITAQNLPVASDVMLPVLPEEALSVRVVPDSETSLWAPGDLKPTAIVISDGKTMDLNGDSIQFLTMQHDSTDPFWPTWIASPTKAKSLHARDVVVEGTATATATGSTGSASTQPINADPILDEKFYDQIREESDEQKLCPSGYVKKCLPSTTENFKKHCACKKLQGAPPQDVPTSTTFVLAQPDITSATSVSAAQSPAITPNCAAGTRWTCDKEIGPAGKRCHCALIPSLALKERDVAAPSHTNRLAHSIGHCNGGKTWHCPQNRDASCWCASPNELPKSMHTIHGNTWWNPHPDMALGQYATPHTGHTHSYFTQTLAPVATLAKRAEKDPEIIPTSLDVVPKPCPAGERQKCFRMGLGRRECFCEPIPHSRLPTPPVEHSFTASEPSRLPKPIKCPVGSHMSCTGEGADKLCSCIHLPLDRKDSAPLSSERKLFAKVSDSSVAELTNPEHPKCPPGKSWMCMGPRGHQNCHCMTPKHLPRNLDTASSNETAVEHLDSTPASSTNGDPFDPKGRCKNGSVPHCNGRTCHCNDKVILSHPTPSAKLKKAVEDSSNEAAPNPPNDGLEGTKPLDEDRCPLGKSFYCGGLGGSKICSCRTPEQIDAIQNINKSGPPHELSEKSAKSTNPTANLEDHNLADEDHKCPPDETWYCPPRNKITTSWACSCKTPEQIALWEKEEYENHIRKLKRSDLPEKPADKKPSDLDAEYPAGEIYHCGGLAGSLACACRTPEAIAEIEEFNTDGPAVKPVDGEKGLSDEITKRDDPDSSGMCPRGRILSCPMHNPSAKCKCEKVTKRDVAMDEEQEDETLVKRYGDRSAAVYASSSSGVPESSLAAVVAIAAMVVLFL